MQQGRASCLESRPQRRLEILVRIDGDAESSARLGHRGEVYRAESGGRPNRSAAQPLMASYRAVSAVIEDEGDHVRPLAYGGLHFGHRHGEAAVA